VTLHIVILLASGDIERHICGTTSIKYLSSSSTRQTTQSSTRVTNYPVTAAVDSRTISDGLCIVSVSGADIRRQLRSTNRHLLAVPRFWLNT